MPAENKSNVLDTAGGEMPNPSAPPHGPTQEELEQTFQSSSRKPPEPRIRESSGDVADQADTEIQNDIQEGIDRARSHLKH
jgi:hypothetical protein